MAIRGRVVSAGVRKTVRPDRWLMACILCTFAAVSLCAQAPAPPSGTAQGPAEMSTRDETATFRVKVNLVLVPVVVRDAKGKAVGGLRREDFQLFDSGKPVTIRHFSMETPESRAAAAEAGVEPVAKLEKPQATAEVPRRFVAYLFDDTHLKSEELSQTRAAVERQLSSSAGPGDRVALYTATGKPTLEFTDDLKSFRDNLAGIYPGTNSVPSECPAVDEYVAERIQREGLISIGDVLRGRTDPHLAPPTVTAYGLNEALLCGAPCLNVGTVSGASPGASVSPDVKCQVFQGTLTWLRSLVSRVLAQRDRDNRMWLGRLRNVVRRMAAAPGERTAVLISPGFHLSTDSEGGELDEIVEEAVRANVVINALDARGIYSVLPIGDASAGTKFDLYQSGQRADWIKTAAGAQSAPMERIADGTGGTFFHNSNDFDDGLRRTTAVPEYSYLLGFSPSNVRMDGSFHPLRVKIPGRRGLTISARREYYVPKRSPDPVEAARQEVEAAMFAHSELNEIPITLRTQFFKSGYVDATLSVLIHFELNKLPLRKAEGRNRDDLAIFAALFDRNGNYLKGKGQTLELRLRDETVARLASGIDVKTDLGDVKTGNYLLRVVVRDAEGGLLTARSRPIQIQ